MKTLYFECKMGAAGDMLQAALYELLDEKQKAKYLASMNQIFGDAVSVNAEPGSQCGISGTHMHVTVLGQEEMPGEDGHEHELHEHELEHEHECHEHEHEHVHEHHDHEHVHECHAHEGHEHVHDHENHEQEHEHHEDLTHEQMHAMGIPHSHDGHEHNHDSLTHEQMHALGIPHSHDDVCCEEHPEHLHEHEFHEDPHHDPHDHHDHVEDHDPHDHHDHHDHHGHDHAHHHAHYSYASVCSQIEHLPLPSAVKADASAIYRLIGEAEAKAHNSTLENIHFHEVGSLDALADVVGCSLLISYLAPEQIIVSPIHVGNGTVKCAHGILPVPAPATAEILKGVPYYTGNINTELCTPTGAAVLKHFANSFGNMPVMSVEASGFGLGNKVFPVANGVRVFLGDTFENAVSMPAAWDNNLPSFSGNRPASTSSHNLPAVSGNQESQLPAVQIKAPEVYEKEVLGDYKGSDLSDTVVEITCNIDDMTGEELGFAMDLLLNAGALDVYYESIYMKKNRPGIKLSCICRPADRDRFTLMILKHTSTRGVRFQLFQRAKLDVRYENIETEYGTVRKKINFGYGVEKTKYEYEDLKKIALEKGISIRDVMELL